MNVNVTPFDITISTNEGEEVISWDPTDFEFNPELIFKMAYLVALAISDETAFLEMFRQIQEGHDDECDCNHPEPEGQLFLQRFSLN